jgi:hypothetical protein
LDVKPLQDGVYSSLRHEAVHEGFADGTDADQDVAFGSARSALDHVPGRRLRPATLQAKQLERPTFLPTLLPAQLKKGDKFAALNQMRALIRKDRETVLDPVSQCIAVDLEDDGGLVDRVTTQRLDAPPVGAPITPDHATVAFSIRARMSSTRHTVMRGPSFTGLGKRPDLTPAHQVDLLTGIGP